MEDAFCSQLPGHLQYYLRGLCLGKEPSAAKAKSLHGKGGSGGEGGLRIKRASSPPCSAPWEFPERNKCLTTSLFCFVFLFMAVSMAYGNSSIRAELQVYTKATATPELGNT